MIATLPIAHATNIIDFMLSGTTTNKGDPLTFDSTGAPLITATAWGFSDNGNNAVSKVGSTTTVSGAPAQLLDTFNGLGVKSTSGLITNSSFVVFDFSGVTASTTAQIELNDITEFWDVYGLNSSTVPSSTGNVVEKFTGVTPLASGGKATDGDLETINNFASYQYIIVIASQDCQAIIDEFQFSTSATTPEPGTFVMAGMALIGLGTMLRKARKG